MKPQGPRMGSNRTGIQMSPVDARRMREHHVDVPPPMLQSPCAAAMAALRARDLADAPPLGSVPPPGSVRGVLSTGVALLSGGSPQLLLDKLGERMAFERIATRLYDALITKVRATAADNGDTVVPLQPLLEHRDQKACHVGLLARSIEQAGGDCTAQTPCADLVGVETAGLVQAVTDPRTSVVQSLHALLMAELADASAWDLLVAMAVHHKRDIMVAAFSQAAEQVRQQLQRVRAWIEYHALGAAPAEPWQAREPGRQ